MTHMYAKSSDHMQVYKHPSFTSNVSSKIARVSLINRAIANNFMNQDVNKWVSKGF